MLVQLPRLTGALRGHYDIDEACLRRKTLLQNLKSRRSTDDSELAKKLVPNWEEASSDVRQAYRQFLGALVEINSEIVSEEFRQVAKAVYDLFSSLDARHDEIRVRSPEKRSEMQRLVGYRISDASILKVASLAHKLSSLQHMENEERPASIVTSGSQDSSFEFGSDLNFNIPSRFLVDVPIEEDDKFQMGLYDDRPMLQNYYTTDKRGSVNLRWLKEVCDRIAGGGGSQLSGDDLAMALSRVILLNKQGDEIAGDLLDLVGDSAFDMVQDILSHRKELVSTIQHGLHILKTENTTSTGQSKMPSYGTQVTIQTESAKQVDKLRRKEEKRNKRGAENGATDELAVADSFTSLLLASERKQPFDDVIGTGERNSLSITALPKGTSRSNYHGYEEVKIPATLTPAMGPNEKLIEIKELDEFAQAAFHGYKTLNRIQSRIYYATYNTNENILVCAPTGAGKTNIAMIAILHEIKQHFREGILHKNEFKIVYVAPMKALAAEVTATFGREVTATFGRRLGPLNLLVRELTGDMQLSRKELEETQMIVTTPEKWDVITRKSSDMSLSMLVKLFVEI